MSIILISYPVLRFLNSRIIEKKSYGVVQATFLMHNNNTNKAESNEANTAKKKKESTIMEDENPEKIVTIFNGSFRLTLLYFALGVLISSGFVACCTLAKLFKQFHFNHANFSVILSNLLICLAINNMIQMGRIFVIFVQWFFGYESKMHANEGESCIISVMNSSITFFILGGLIFSLIERSYATMNYIKYEHEDYSNAINKAFNIFWFIAGFVLFISGMSSLATFSTRSYYSCVINEIKNDPLKLNWQVLVCTICMLVFLLFFVLLLRTNVERRAKTEQPQSQYRLGTAYQLRENCYGIRLMLWFTSLFFVFLLLYLYHIQSLYINYSTLNYDYDVEYMVFWQEFGVLYYALFTIILPSVIIFSSAAICRRLNDLWQAFRQSWKSADSKSRRGSLILKSAAQLLPRYTATSSQRHFDALNDYWESKLHTM